MEEWGNSNWVEPYFEKKKNLNLFSKKTPKMATFPSCGSVSPSLMIWIEQNVFGNPIGNLGSNTQEKMIMSLNPSHFLVFPMWIMLSHISPVC